MEKVTRGIKGNLLKKNRQCQTKPRQSRRLHTDNDNLGDAKGGSSGKGSDHCRLKGAVQKAGRTLQFALEEAKEDERQDGHADADVQSSKCVGLEKVREDGHEATKKVGPADGEGALRTRKKIILIHNCWKPCLPCTMFRGLFQVELEAHHKVHKLVLVRRQRSKEGLQRDLVQTVRLENHRNLVQFTLQAVVDLPILPSAFIVVVFHF